jgi:hypothetical protein
MHDFALLCLGYATTAMKKIADTAKNIASMHKKKKDRYNRDWLAVSSDIRIRRANNRCEFCGLEHGRLIHWKKFGHDTYASQAELEQLEMLKAEGLMTYWQRLKALKLKQVCLTVAHLDHNERNDDPKNLLALCQWCHLSYDRADNAARRCFGYNREQLPISYTEDDISCTE